MKQDWEFKPLKDIGKIVSGATPKSKVAEYWDGVISWITPKDLGTLGGQKYILGTSRKITELGLSSCSAQLMPKGSVIMSSRAPIGHLGIATDDICTNQGCKSIVPNENMNSEYIYYYLLSSKEALNKLGTGAVFPELSGKMFGDFIIPVPSIEEQQQIVEKLDQAFEFIDRAKANIEQNIINAKELFQSKLEEVFSQNGDGWELENITSVSKQIFAGGDVDKNNLSQIRTIEYNIPIFTNGEKNEGLYGFTSIARVNEKALTISARGTIGFTMIREEPFYPAVRLITIIPKEILDIYFLRYFIKSKTVTSSGASIPQLTVPMVKEWTISFPESLEIQKDIVKVLDEISDESDNIISFYNQKLENLEELRKSILEKAFRGELTN